MEQLKESKGKISVSLDADVIKAIHTLQGEAITHLGKSVSFSEVLNVAARIAIEGTILKEKVIPKWQKSLKSDKTASAYAKAMSKGSKRKGRK